MIRSFLYQPFINNLVILFEKHKIDTINAEIHEKEIEIMQSQGILQLDGGCHNKDYEVPDSIRKDAIAFLSRKILNGVSRELDYFDALTFHYLYELISKISVINDYSKIFFKITNKEEVFIYCMEEKEVGTYIIHAESPDSLALFLDVFDKFYEEYSKSNSKTLEGKDLAFTNCFLLFLFGIDEIEERIEKEQKELLDSIPLRADKKFINIMERALSFNWDYRFYYYEYIMTVFSFIEHTAILVLPFWFALRNDLSYWQEYLDAINNINEKNKVKRNLKLTSYENFHEFWKSNRDYVIPFMKVLCFEDTENSDQRKLASLYSNLRKNCRNPIHHGLSNAGLSYEVPSIDKRVVFGMSPLVNNIDLCSFEMTKKMYNLFIKVLKEHNHDIYKYLETGWNVPLDCTELGWYIISDKLDYFIEQYEIILSHYDDMVNY